MKEKQQSCWQHQLSDSITSLSELCELLHITIHDLDKSQQASADFSFRVPRAFVKRMKIADPHDPLLLQVLPQAQELLVVPGYSHDPVGDTQSNPMPGLLHKYKGRVLFIVSGGCAVNCRYCFRRHFSYKENMPGKKGWQKVIEYVAADDSIEEVILSGGDPLTIKDAEFEWLLRNIENIKHVKRLRIHSRLPIMIPDRVTPMLLSLLENTRLQTVLVVHCNHPDEVDDSVAVMLRCFQKKGICVLNQVVLLKNVNDNAATLIALNKKLFTCGVLPYYLHMLDKVSGAAHFDVSEAQALVLLKQMRENLPGYLMPALVREDAGGRHKNVVV